MTKSKKGVSPIVATVLLIMLVVIIAIIILSWARGWFGESIIKNIGDKEARIDSFCGDVKLQKILNEDTDTFGFTNVGNIPVYAVILKTTRDGDSTSVKIEKESGGRVNPGVSTQIGNDYSLNQEVKIIPILIGRNKGGGLEEHECSESHALII
jgi:flagellin-like protein